MKNPILTIIVPVYNGEKYIRTLLECISRYNSNILPSLEVLLIDDGSSDNSFQVCQELSSTFTFMKCFTKKNSGIADTRSFGLKHTRGQYVTFCDQDDLLDEGFETFIRKLESTKSDILIANYKISSLNQIEENRYFTIDEVCEGEKKIAVLRYLIGGSKLFPKECLDNNCIRIPNTVWNCIFKMDIVLANNLLFKAIVDYEDDWRFIVEYCLKANRIYLSKDSYYIWHVNPSSESHTRKYIIDFYKRRRLAVASDSKYLSQINATKREIEYRRILEKKRDIIWGFYNCEILPYKQFVDEMNQIIDASSPIEKKIYLFTEAKCEKFYLFFLLKRIYIIPHVINKYLLRMKYH